MHQALVDTIKCSMVLLPLLRDDTAVASKFVDTRGYKFVEFHILVGATDITFDAKLQESVNADGSSPSDVTGGAITQISATGDNVMCVISALVTTLTKRYAGVLVDPGDGTLGTNVAVESFRWGKSGNLPEELEAAGSNSYATAEVIRV